MVTSVCPFNLALNFSGTVMSFFSTVIVSNDVWTSLGKSRIFSFWGLSVKNTLQRYKKSLKHLHNLLFFLLLAQKIPRCNRGTVLSLCHIGVRILCDMLLWNTHLECSKNLYTRVNRRGGCYLNTHPNTTPNTPPDIHPSGLGCLEWNHLVIRLVSVRLTLEAEFLHRHSQMNLRAVIVLD